MDEHARPKHRTHKGGKHEIAPITGKVLVHDLLDTFDGYFVEFFNDTDGRLFAKVPAPQPKPPNTQLTFEVRT